MRPSSETGPRASPPACHPWCAAMVDLLGATSSDVRWDRFRQARSGLAGATCSRSIEQIHHRPQNICHARLIKYDTSRRCVANCYRSDAKALQNHRGATAEPKEHRCRCFFGLEDDMMQGLIGKSSWSGDCSILEWIEWTRSPGLHDIA